MNKHLTASVLAVVLPLSIQVFAVEEDTVTAKAVNTTAVVVKKTDTTSSTAVSPVDLDTAVTEYDIVLPPQPVRMTADSLYIRNQDGYVQGRGNVDINQGMDEVHGNYVEGNTKTQLYSIPGPIVWIQGTTALQGEGLVYNAKTRSGTMDAVSGFVSPAAYVRGTGGAIYDGQGYLKHGLITTPHAVAKTPDYYLTGDDIYIYPGNKFTSENTKLWFKHVCIFTYGHYEDRLDSLHKTNTQLFSLLPRPDYSSSNGFGVYGGAKFPLNYDETFNLNFEYMIYTKAGFRPTIQFERDTRYGRFTFGYDSEESTLNDDHIWARKFPEFDYYMPRINFGRTGIYMDNSVNWGRWAEDDVETGTHKGYHTEITHTPIPLWKQANLRFFAGYRKDMYATDDDVRRDPYNGVVLNQGINDHFWTSWWYTKHNISGATPYQFDTIDTPRQKGVSVGYVLTPRDTFILTFDKNLDTGEVADRNFTWMRDLHSFVAAITWKSIDKSWEVHVRAKDF